MSVYDHSVLYLYIYVLGLSQEMGELLAITVNMPWNTNKRREIRSTIRDFENTNNPLKQVGSNCKRNSNKREREKGWHANIYLRTMPEWCSKHLIFLVLFSFLSMNGKDGWIFIVLNLRGKCRREREREFGLLLTKNNR